MSAPSVGHDAWRELRESHDWGRSSAAYTGRAAGEALRVLSELRAASLLGWEAALIASYAEDGLIGADHALTWVRLFEEAGELDEPTFRGRVMQLRLASLGSALSALTPACLGTHGAPVDALERVAAIEGSAPARRLYRRWPTLGGDDLTELLDELRVTAPVFHAASVLALRRLVEPIEEAGEALDWPAIPEGWDACGGARLAALMELEVSGDSGHQRASSSPESGDYPVSSKVLWRAAIHQYLRVDAPGLERVSSIFAQLYANDEAGQLHLAALRDIVDGAIDAPRRRWPTEADATNPTYRWVFAEHLRLRGEFRRAYVQAALLVDSDPQALQAWLTHAAVAMRLGHWEAARNDLSVLESQAPEGSALGGWAIRLRSALERVPSEE